MGSDLGMVGSVVVPIDTPPFANVCIRVVDPDWIPKLSADDLIDVQIGAIPEVHAASEQPIVVIRYCIGDWLFDGADPDILPQAAVDGREVVVDDHAGAGSRCMNWRTGSDVRYR